MRIAATKGDIGPLVILLNRAAKAAVDINQQALLVQTMVIDKATVSHLY